MEVVDTIATRKRQDTSPVFAFGQLGNILIRDPSDSE